MKKWCLVSAAVVMSWLCGQQPAYADTVTIGKQHFTDGTKITTSAYLTAVSGQPAPFFNAFCGFDATTNCSANWVFNYVLPTGDSITGATLTLGIFDIDSAAPGNQVGSFMLDGSDSLTSQLNASSEAASSLNSFYNVLTITIPSGFFIDLQSGSAKFALTLSGPGLGVLGTTPFNGAGLDFSTLDIASQPSTPPTPEPATWLLLLTGILGFGIARTLLKQP